jgi:hypothetical protein
MAKLLKEALAEGRYDVAAYVLVYGLLKAKQYGKERRTKRQKARLLRPGAG